MVPVTPQKRLSLKLIPVIVSLVLSAAACSTADTEPAAGTEPALRILTTVSPITSLVESLAGDRATVEGLVPEGANSHTFDPSPRTAQDIVEADVVFLNGLQLEEPLRQMVQANIADTATVVLLGDEVLDPAEYRFDFSFPEDGGKPNPHLWTDPAFVEAYGEVVVATLSNVDPAGSAVYSANLETLRATIAQLDEAMRQSFATIADGDRVLLTYHDAYAYFADNYGFRVIGAVQPADFASPTAKDVAALIDQIRASDVPAIFGSEVFPSPVLEQIAAETGGTFIGSLRDDDLPGEPGDPEHTWFGLLRSNYIVMTEALNGDASALRSLGELVEPGQATYPQ